MSAKSIAFAAALALVVSVAMAGPPLDFVHPVPTIDSINLAAARVKSSRCATKQCQAITSIATVLAIDLDTRSDGHFLPALLAHLPRSPAVDLAIQHARDLCNNDNAHDPASCGVIGRP